jgi:hypothetical protein
VNALVRPWNPSCLVIKGPRNDGYKHTCDNEGCDAPGQVVFEQANAIWIACDQCKPEGVTVLATLMPNISGERTVAREVKP